MLVIVLLILAIAAFTATLLNAPRINWTALGLILCVLAWLLPLLGAHT